MRRLILADKREVEVSVFLAEVEVKRRKGHAFVAELEMPLLGVYALETLGFKVNPRTGEIEGISPEGGYLLTAKVSERNAKKKYKNSFKSD